MNKSISQLSSDSSSGSYTSDESSSTDDYESETIVDINDIISWNSIEGNLSNFSETFKQFSSTKKIFLLKSRCLSNSCQCNFKNNDLLIARVFVNTKVLIGKWCKLRFSKTAVPETDKIGTFIFFKDFRGWYEIMNENLEVIPSWNNVSQIIQNKPKSFILRKDSKCFSVKDDTISPIVFENCHLKEGSILSFSQYRKYPIKKGRRTKEQFLCKCNDENGAFFYFFPDEPLLTSPIAGDDNISGAHTFQSIIDKFHYPINVKPIFNEPPLRNLPFSERHFLQLTQRFQMDLIFVTPAKEDSRMFIMTPDLFNDHRFTIGEFLLLSVVRNNIPIEINRFIDLHNLKIDSFFNKCHKYENLSYLLKNAENVSKIAQKFEPMDSDEFNEIYIEIEGIYFYIRNGFFPRNFAVKKELNKVETVVIESSADRQDDGDSSGMSLTSSESHLTSSTALEMFKKMNRIKSAKSMPLGKSKIKKNANNRFTNVSNSRYNLDVNGDDKNASFTNLCTSGSFKKVAEVLKFYRKEEEESDIDITSLRDTVV